MSGLAGLLTGGVIEAVGKVADDLITSDEERASAELEARKLDNALLLGQQEINKVEAGHASLFVSGWRAAAGWVSVMALWCVYVPKALIMTGFWAFQTWVILSAWNRIAPAPALPSFPDLGVTDLIGLLFALLGMAGLRHRETLAGKARETLGPKPVSGQQEAP
jgi:hypothetical protein